MRLLRIGAIAVSAALAAMYSAALAGEADVLAVEVAKERAGVYRFDVTVRHADDGWEHYADAWDVVAPDGGVIATRALYHPHVGEQPFTRSLSGVAVPAGVRRVSLRAHDKVSYSLCASEAAAPILE
ncbi:MAG: hypothetical protein ACE5LF_07130 [Alphaproteobacteria bacterium]